VNAFSAVVQGDSSGAMVEVPADVLAALAAPSRRARVRVTINDAELRTTLAVYGGKSYIGLRKDYRAAAGIAPGSEVDVRLELDEEARSVDVPSDLAAVLDVDAETRSAFERLSLTNQREYVSWVVSAKRPEARARRLAAAPGLLKGGRRTPLSA
jgi:hypothetical protein